MIACTSPLLRPLVLRSGCSRRLRRPTNLVSYTSYDFLLVSGRSEEQSSSIVGEEVSDSAALTAVDEEVLVSTFQPLPAMA